jgi:NAD(P)-dependent dehydrogenase (short-subunit alcohol dehydrogenase family)
MCTRQCAPFKDTLFDSPPGDYLEAGLGTPPGILEEQVRAILISVVASRFNKKILAQLSKTAALGCVGVPTDIAPLVSFLASKESQLITGQSVSITAPGLSASLD